MKSEVKSLTNRLKTGMRSLLVGAKPSPDYSLIIETDFEREKHLSKLDEMDPNLNFSDDFKDVFDAKTYENLQSELEAAIKEAAERKMYCQMIYSSDLISHIAKDLLLMSIAEPCGVRGSIIYIILQEKERHLRLATILGSLSTPPTFEIHLTLKEDSKSWRMFQKIFYTIKGCILNSQWTSLPKILCSAYQLEKRKLYRSSNSVDTNIAQIH